MKAKVIIKMIGKQTQIQNPAMEADIKKFSFDYSYNSMCDPSDRAYITQSQVYNDLGKARPWYHLVSASAVNSPRDYYL